jgi:methylmalonyl-CoA epimerase
MLTLTRVDHIAQVVPELVPQRELLEGLFGFRLEREWEDEATDSARVILAVPGRGGLRWELLAPRGAESELQPFLDGPHGPGIHHVSMEVADITAAAGELRAAGVEPRATTAGSAPRLDVPADADGRGLAFHLHAAGAFAPPLAVEEAPDAGTLGVIGIDHVCHVTPDRDELGGWYARLFGMRETHRTPPGQHDDLADLVMDVPGGQMRWEVLQPVGEGSFVQRFLDRRGPSVHHIAFEVADWARALAACERHGLSPFDESTGETDGAAYRDVFLHPRETGGVLVQLFWEETRGAWVASDKVPSGAGETTAG